MEIGGVVPLDAPDPDVGMDARIRSLPFPVMQLFPQRALTRVPGATFMESRGSVLSVSLSYALWRYPDDHSDPRNELELDEFTALTMELEPPWGRPDWLADDARLYRYPVLSEAVRTTWHADPEAAGAGLAQQLMDHADHILMNEFREELGLPLPIGEPREDGWRVSAAAVVPSTARVDGRERPAVHVDTDPFVYGFGFRIDPHLVCTTVVSRDSLPLLDLAITTLV
ncbi:hypothetical protein [Microbacterium gorillae]|uniref:hypothetical protein n=1 Tax=Microbacterium gorillae TaxID=1231063 RepID=UPI00058D42C3|nr:hypothetical protein [Microbacterium gorillae]